MWGVLKQAPVQRLADVGGASTGNRAGFSKLCGVLEQAPAQGFADVGVASTGNRAGFYKLCGVLEQGRVQGLRPADTPNTLICLWAIPYRVEYLGGGYPEK